MKEKTLLTELGKFLAEIKYDALPADVVDLAKTRVLDATGSAVAGRDLPPSVVAWRTVKDNPKGPSTIWGYGTKVSPEDAVLANGVMTHSTLHEDIGPTGHPCTYVVPTVIAVGQQVGASGKQIIEAVVAGYESTGRIRRGLTQIFQHRGFRSGPILAPFGAAAAAGRLWSFTPEQMANALGFAGNLSSGLYQGYIPGTMEPYYHAGFGGRNGVIAAMVSRAGGLSSPWALQGNYGFYKTFSGTDEKAADVVQGLGKEYTIREMNRKPYPICQGCMEAMDFALEVGKKVGDASKIDYVIVKTPARNESIPGAKLLPPYENILQAQMSTRFCTAAGLLGKPVETFHYFRDHYDDPEVAALTYRIQVEGDDQRKNTRIEVHLRDGKTLSLDEKRVFPPTPKLIEEKFVDEVGEMIGRAKAKKAAGVIMGLEKLDDVEKLVANLVKSK